MWWGMSSDNSFSGDLRGSECTAEKIIGRQDRCCMLLVAHGEVCRHALLCASHWLVYRDARNNYLLTHKEDEKCKSKWDGSDERDNPVPGLRLEETLLLETWPVQLYNSRMCLR